MRRITAVILLAAAITGASSCATSGGGGTRAGGSDGPTGAGSAEPVDLVDLVVQGGDIRPDETAASPQAANDLGTASLRYCARPFPSEDLRTARHQVVVRDESREWTSVTEAMRYSPGGAAQAVAEMRAAFVDCPEDELIDPYPGERSDPVLQRHEAFPLAEEDLVDVADDHVAARVTITNEDGEVTVSYFVLQRRGDVAVTTIATDEEQVLELAGSIGRRLAAAPAGSLGG